MGRRWRVIQGRWKHSHCFNASYSSWMCFQLNASSLLLKAFPSAFNASSLPWTHFHCYLTLCRLTTVHWSLTPLHGSLMPSHRYLTALWHLSTPLHFFSMLLGRPLYFLYVNASGTTFVFFICHLTSFRCHLMKWISAKLLFITLLVKFVTLSGSITLLVDFITLSESIALSGVITLLEQNIRIDIY